MNYSFKVKDIVQFAPNSGRRPRTDFELIKRFVDNVFHGRFPDGTIVRVRTHELVRVRRPSDEVKRVEVDQRKALHAADLQRRRDMVARRREEFSSLSEIGIRLTADGLPDKRMKPRYTAKTSPVIIKTRKRSGLL